MQDSRRRIWIDAQALQFASFAALNAWLGERCRALWTQLRHPEHTQFSVADMLEQEREQMMPMPTPFDGYVEKWVFRTNVTSDSGIVTSHSIST